MHGKERKGRNIKKLKALAQPKPRKLRKPLRPFKRKDSVLKQIPGCKGIWSELAARLGCAVSTVQRALTLPGWECVREAFDQEKVAALDTCIMNVYQIADYSTDTPSALNANKFLLEKLHPKFHPTAKIIHEGGDKPIQHQHVTFQIPADILNRSVEDRMEVLNMIELKEKEMEEGGGE